MSEHASTSEPADVRPQSLLWRISKWLILSVGLSVGLIVATGAIYQFSMTQWESHRYPAPGKLVDIGGLRLHINCTGAGSPAVLLEAGPNDSSVIWQIHRPELVAATVQEIVNDWRGTAPFRAAPEAEYK